MILQEANRLLPQYDLTADAWDIPRIGRLKHDELTERERTLIKLMREISFEYEHFLQLLVAEDPKFIG